MTDDERRAREDLMILGLRQAIDNGFAMATPGSSDAVRAAFPDFFATEAEVEGVATNDELEVDDYPLVSRGDKGCFVGAWVWVEYPEPIDEDDDEDSKDETP